MSHVSRTVIGIMTTIIFAASEVPQILLIMIPSFFILNNIYHFTKEAQIEFDRVKSVNETPRFTFQSETLAGLPTIRAYSKQQMHIDQDFKLKDDCVKCWVWCHTIGRYKDLRLRLLSQLFSFVITSLCIVSNSGADTQTVIFLPLLITYCEELTWQFGGLFWCATDFENRMKKANNCFEILKIKHENFDEKISVKDLDIKSVKETGDKKACWPPKGSLEFKDVVLRYRPDTKQVLTGLSFKLSPGQKLGVIGRTGAGKSTLCLAISRLMEIESGNILVDD